MNFDTLGVKIADQNQATFIRGEDRTFQLRIFDAENFSPFDLNGYTGNIFLRKDDDTSVQTALTVEGQSTARNQGKIILTLTALFTSTLKTGLANAEIHLLDGSSKKRIVQASSLFNIVASLF